MVSHHLMSLQHRPIGTVAREEGFEMKNVQQHYDEEAYDLDNIYNDDDLYSDWYQYRGTSVYTDDTLYQVSGDETSIWYN